MRSKNVAGFLAFFVGIFGIHRLYLGQYLLGVLYLLFPPVAAVILSALTGDWLQHASTEMNLANFELFSKIFFAPILFYVPIFILAIIDAIVLFARSKASFDQKYNKKEFNAGKTILWSMLTVAICAVIMFFLYQAYFSEQDVDVSGEDAAYTLTGEEIAHIFSNDAAAFDEYGNKVLQITGIVVDEEFYIATGERSLILRGNDEINIKCSFKPDQQAKVEGVLLGNEITIKGFLHDIANALLLQDCILLDVQLGIPAEAEETDTFSVNPDTMNVVKDNLKIDVDTLRTPQPTQE